MGENAGACGGFVHNTQYRLCHVLLFLFRTKDLFWLSESPSVLSLLVHTLKLLEIRILIFSRIYNSEVLIFVNLPPEPFWVSWHYLLTRQNGVRARAFIY